MPRLVTSHHDALREPGMTFAMYCLVTVAVLYLMRRAALLARDRLSRGRGAAVALIAVVALVLTLPASCGGLASDPPVISCRSAIASFSIRPPLILTYDWPMYVALGLPLLGGVAVVRRPRRSDNGNVTADV